MLFQEIQYPDWWFFVILVGVGLLVPILFVSLAWIVAKQGHRFIPGVMFIVAGLVLLFCAGVFVTFGKMTTEVSNGQVRVSFGWLPVSTRTVPAETIGAAESVDYDPMAEYGGWGIRGREGDRALNMRGSKGVRLTLTENGTLLIGSQRPADLADAVVRLKAAPR